MSEKATQVTKAGEQPPVQKLPAGWWRLAGLEGSRIGVLAALDASELPAHWKLALEGTVTELDARLNHVKLDAHCQIEKGHIMVSVHVKASTVL